MFDTEENMINFEKFNKPFLKTKPKLPNTYNVAIIGPKKSGKKSMAEKLCKTYGWK